jgi:hypothetical protein
MIDVQTHLEAPFNMFLRLASFIQEAFSLLKAKQCSRYSDFLRPRRTRDRILVGGGGGEVFYTCPDWPGGPPCLLYNGYGLFPGGTADGA